jgi:pyrroloquinoline quinone (PQQ) biosynthesis protein C
MTTEFVNAVASKPSGTGKTPNLLADKLDRLIADHMTNVVEQTELYRLISNPDSSPALVAALVRHTMIESFSFTPSLCATTLRAIGKMPHEMPEAMKQAFLHIYEELGHSEMALRTFKALGGDESWARGRRMTPGSLAMCGAFDRIVDTVSGLAYIGVWYPLEVMTGLLTERGTKWLEAKGIGSGQREFIDVHAVDDIAHQRSMRNLMGKFTARYSSAAEEIEYATQVILSVYPVPIWQGVVKRAKADCEGAGNGSWDSSR